MKLRTKWIRIGGLIRSWVFASFNHLEEGIFRYQVLLIHTKGHISVLDLFHSISCSTFQSSNFFLEFHWVGWIMNNKKISAIFFWVYKTFKYGTHISTKLLSSKTKRKLTIEAIAQSLLKDQDLPRKIRNNNRVLRKLYAFWWQETKMRAQVSICDFYPWLLIIPWTLSWFFSWIKVSAAMFCLMQSSGQSLSEWSGDKSEFSNQVQKVFRRCESS